VSDPELEAAWNEVHDATPAGWSVMRPIRHDEERDRPWHVVAVDYRTSSRHHLEATGRTEAAPKRLLCATVYKAPTSRLRSRPQASSRVL
jgi:hypothetical protein